jgi:hypothetical protein
MKAKFYYLLFFGLGLLYSPLQAQKVYTLTSGEIIFSQSQASFTKAFTDSYSGASLSGNNVRFTMFFHVGQYLHYDVSKNFGLFSGLVIRNIGMITDETLPQTVALTGSSVPPSYKQYKIIRRQYTLGLPLAFKIGDFDKHLYFFAGGEYEMAFHFKEKYWTGNYERSGSKTKKTEWFSNQTPTFLPSVFGGFQFPGGVNVKFRYYLTDFLDSNYKGNGNALEGAIFDVSDQSRYQESQLFYVSLCWQFNPEDFMHTK